MMHPRPVGTGTHTIPFNGMGVLERHWIVADTNPLPLLKPTHNNRPRYLYRGEIEIDYLTDVADVVTGAGSYEYAILNSDGTIARTLLKRFVTMRHLAMPLLYWECFHPSTPYEIDPSASVVVRFIGEPPVPADIIVRLFWRE